MKKLMAIGAALCLTAMISGCAREAKVKEKETVSTPGGTTTTTKETKIKSTGDSPPVSSEGKSVPPKSD